MADARRPLLPLVAMAVPIVLLGFLALTPASRVGLVLEDLELDGLRATLDSSGGFLESLPLAEATVLADVGRRIDSVVVITETGERLALPGMEQLVLRPEAPDAGGTTLQLSSMEMPADSAFEIQSEGGGVHRLFLPAGDPRALTLGGRWWVDTTLVDFGEIGIGRIVVDTRDPVLVDFRIDDTRPHVRLMEEVAIGGLHLSRLRPLSDEAESTVRGGVVASDWMQETLEPGSRVSFERFEGIVDSLWIAGETLRADIRGTDVEGLSVDGSERMPSLLQARPAGQRRALLAVLLGTFVLAGAWVVVPGVRQAGVRPGPVEPHVPGRPGTTAVPSRKLAAIWFADIVGFTELSSRDEDGALALSQELEQLARREVELHGGRVVKLLGDGLLTEFGSTDAAVRAALGLQASFSASDLVTENRSALRIGVHVCEVVATPDGDVTGSGVNIASRIESAAEPGRVAVSEDVARQLGQRGEFRLEPMRPVRLKGLKGPAQLFLVDWAGA